jgi:heptosyltransferase-2
MATPALRALREHIGPTGTLVGIMRPYVAEVLAGLAWLDEQVLYDKPASRFSLAAGDAYQQLRASQLDRIVLLTNSLRTAWMAWRSGARERIGYVGDMRSWLLSHPLPQPNTAGNVAPASTIDGYMRLAEVAGCTSVSAQMQLATTPADEAAADHLGQRLSLPPGERVVVLNSGGAFGVAKHWPAEYFAELARRIVADHDLYVLVHCGPAERAIAGEIVARAAHPRIVGMNGIAELPIGLAKACIRRSRLLVTTDSGPRFFGIAFGRPVVTLFGPTDPRRTESHYDGESCVSLALDCQPCMARECPLGHHRCMRELTVDRVYSAVRDKLSSPASSLVTSTAKPHFNERPRSAIA